MARDLTVIWGAPVKCRGRRLTKADVLKRVKGTYLAPMVKAAEYDEAAQRVLYQAGVSYHAGCGADLRDVQHDLLEEHGRGVRIDYECPACGAPHHVRFGVVPE